MAHNRIETFHILWSFKHVWKLLLNPLADDTLWWWWWQWWWLSVCLNGHLGEPPFPAPSHTWQLYVYVLSSAHLKEASEPICTWHLELRTTSPSEGSLMRALKKKMHSTIRTRMLPVVPYTFCLQIEGMNELSAKILMVCHVKWKWRWSHSFLLSIAIVMAH